MLESNMNAQLRSSNRIQRSCRKLFLGLPAILTICGTLSSGVAVAWPEWNHPDLFLFGDEALETKDQLLPPVGNAVSNGGHTPWSDTYWPDNDIGIAVRYVDKYGNTTPQKTRSDVVLQAQRPGALELKQKSQDEIDALSASEKFDIANNDYHYTLTNRVIDGLNGQAHYAYGICHGWSAAASNYPEPQPKEFINKDGIKIRFGASDIKGLMSFYYAWEAAQRNEKKMNNWEFRTDAQNNTHYWQADPNMVYFQYRQLGERCFASKAKCKDQTIDPGALDLVLRNVIGRYHRSFELQGNNGKDIWNYPIIGYARKVLEEQTVEPSESNYFARKKLLVATDLYFTDVTAPQHATTNGTFKNPDDLPPGYDRLGLSIAQSPGAIDSKHLVYNLFLDQDGNVVAGEWKSETFGPKERKTDHIGFVWRASRVPFLGKFKILNELYESKETTVNSYAASLNYTPSLRDLFMTSSSNFSVFNWNLISQ